MSSETLVLFAFGALRVVDGSVPRLGTAGAGAGRPPAVDVLLDEVGRPPGLAITTRPGLVGFSFPGGEAGNPPTREERVVAGTPTPADLLPPDRPPLQLRGELRDPRRGFLPRRFDVTLERPAQGPASEAELRVFPRPPRNVAGLRAFVRGQAVHEGGQPASWALLQLRAQVLPSLAFEVSAQADEDGHFLVPLGDLPTPPEGSVGTSAELRAQAAPPGALRTPAGVLRVLDLDTFPPAELEAPGGFGAALALPPLTPETRLVRDADAPGGPLVLRTGP